MAAELQIGATDSCSEIGEVMKHTGPGWGKRKLHPWKELKEAEADVIAGWVQPTFIKKPGPKSVLPVSLLLPVGDSPSFSW